MLYIGLINQAAVGSHMQMEDTAPYPQRLNDLVIINSEEPNAKVLRAALKHNVMT